MLRPFGIVVLDFSWSKRLKQGYNFISVNNKVTTFGTGGGGGGGPNESLFVGEHPISAISLSLTLG